MSRRFWNWSDPHPDTNEVRVLHINGPIAEESWFDDETTPTLFENELKAGTGDITVWINSPGGDCIAAAQIYNMLLDYPGHVTVIIDGLAASAASVIAMAASTVKMTPVSMMMIHNPATLAAGDTQELGRAIDMLQAVKESIINAYELKTGMQRAKLARLMDAETWMDATAAMQMGFADEIHTGTIQPLKASGVVFNRHQAELALVNKITHQQPALTQATGRSIAEAYAALMTAPH
ncbi:head maturation protease, ClpP-related [Rothia sp. 32237D007AR]